MPKKKAEKPVEVIETPWTPALGEGCVFTNENNDFIASIVSFDPLVVIEHSIKNGVKSETELSIDSLDEYDIRPLSKDEYWQRLG